jgi:hypothetical protein
MADAGPAPDLIVPVRMDVDKAIARLQKLSSQGKQAGDDVAGGVKNAEKSLHALGAGAAGAASALLKLNLAQIGMNSLKQLGEKMTGVLSDAADYAKKLAADFVQIQKAMQDVVAITGQKNNDKFVLEEIKKGEAANLTPAEWTDFREKYTAQTSMYVGDTEGSKMSPKESEELESIAAEFAKAKGISTGDIANTIGGMLVQKKGKTTSKEMLKDLDEVYATLEAASADPKQLMSGMTELMAAGFTSKTAAQTLAQMPEIASHQEATYVQQTVMDIAEQTRARKLGAAQGVEVGAEPRQQLKGLTTFLRSKMDEGATPQEREKILQAEIAKFTTQDIAIRTLSGLARQGPKAMEEWEKIVDKTPADQISRSIAEDRASNAGKVRAVEAKQTAAKVKTGAEEQPVQLRMAMAEAELEKEKRFTRPQLAELANDWIPKFMEADCKLREQQINVRALYRAKQEVGDEDMTAVGTLSMSNRATDKALMNLLEKIEENTRKKGTEKVLEDASKGAARNPTGSVVGAIGIPLSGTTVGGGWKRGA